MRWFPVGVLGVHALIHLMGVFKAFGYAELAQLTQPISRASGIGWLVTAGLVATTATMLGAGSRSYWVVGAVALVVSQVVIVSAWRDAWAGTAANVLLLLVVAHGLLTEGPWSFHEQYIREAGAGLARTTTLPVVTEGDLAALPEPVRRYLRLTRTVGQPRVQSYRLRFRGRIRSAPDSRWMPFEAEQQSFADQPTRLFLMRARMFGVPVEAFHRSVGGRATMQVTIAGVVPVEDARGDEMNRAETVTLFNDMCLLAPGTLIDRRITWQPVDATTARARFTYGGQTIGATLFFNSTGELVNFVSDDRSRSDPEGTFTAHRFSTPVRDYRDFGAVRLMSFGEARWLLPDGEFTYGEFHLVEIAYNTGDSLTGLPTTSGPIERAVPPGASGRPASARARPTGTLATHSSSRIR
ncbi:MAG: DUF6544 family protein [Vicinamibacteraceae bacterium]